MATRKNTIILKRSNVAGKVPSAGDLLLGELAINTSDVILYASGTTSDSILPIGWDRIARTGDSVTGDFYINGVISATTISAETVTVNQYIDFNTATTTYKAGRTYYDSNENALSYFPDTVSGNVTINIGQETLIKVYNNSGYDIYNGQACHINGSYNNTPSVVLAIANAFSAESVVSGIATHNIENGQIGFITARGIVRDLTITGVSEGSTIYLSDISAGAFIYNIDDVGIISRLNKIGVVITTGVTTAKILVDILNEDAEISLTTKERNIFIGGAISNGVFEFSGITKTSDTTFDVAPAKGWIINNTSEYVLSPETTYINYSGQTGLTTIYLSSATLTYLMLTTASTLSMQGTFPTPQDRREKIYLGKIVHPERTTIQIVESQPDFNISPLSQLRDMFEPIKLINDSVIVSVNGANLKFNTSSGTVYGMGINFVNNQLIPDSISVSANTPTTFKYRTQTGGTSTDYTDIDVLNYDNGGVITAIGTPAKQATNQRIYLIPSGGYRVQYGQQIYPTLTDAVVGIQTESFVVAPGIKENAILVGIISVTQGCTSLSSTTDAQFIMVSKFGELMGGTAGISTTTLQQAYDNSTNPEILTNSVLDGVQFRGGTGNDNDKNIIVENNAGNQTAWINANGTAIFNGITATTISGTTYQGLPMDIYTTGVTIADNVFYFDRNDALSAYSVSLSAYASNVAFTAHTGDTTIHYQLSSITLSNIGDSAHTHPFSSITSTPTTLSGYGITDAVNSSLFDIYTGTTVPNTYETIANFSSHTGNTSNPHNVTVEQIGTYSATTIDSNFVHKSGDTMTGALIVNSNLTVTSDTSLQDVTTTKLEVTLSGSEYLGVVISDSNLSHGMTSIVPTNVFGSMEEYSTTNGGFVFRGLCGNDAATRPLTMAGYAGHATPTMAALTMRGAKKNGTTGGALAATEPVIYFENYTTVIGAFLGSGNFGIGTTTPTAKLHIDAGTATASALKFTANATTGILATDGVDFGIDTSGNAEIRQRENLDINFYSNNLLRHTIKNDGTFNVTGNTTINGGLTVTGNTIISGTTTLYKNLITPPTTIATDLTATTEHIIIAATGLTITLPTAVGNNGIQYNIVRTGGENVIIQPISAQTISGDANLTLTNQWDSVVILSDSTQWVRIS